MGTGDYGDEQLGGAARLGKCEAIIVLLYCAIPDLTVDCRCE